MPSLEGVLNTILKHIKHMQYNLFCGLTSLEQHVPLGKELEFHLIFQIYINPMYTNGFFTSGLIQ